MIGMKVKTRTDMKKVLRKTRRANIENLGHAGATIRLIARRSIRKRKGPAPAGQPPHTRRGQLRGAILYAVEKEKERVVIGPGHSKVGKSGSAHEQGGRYKRTRYRRRPFMGPALVKVKPRLPRMWAGSVR